MLPERNKELKVFGVKDILDALPLFRAWIEQTKLFSVLVETTSGSRVAESFTGVGVRIESPEISINLNDGIIIKTPYDLPLPVLEEFFRNSPFYIIKPYEKTSTENDINQQFKLLDND